MKVLVARKVGETKQQKKSKNNWNRLGFLHFFNIFSSPILKGVGVE